MRLPARSLLLLLTGVLLWTAARTVFAAEAIAVKALPDDPACTAEDRKFMARANELAVAAVAHGNTAYGAILVRDGKVLMEFENDAITSRNVTHHAETGIIAVASVKFGLPALAGATLYTSTEPCIMCCGAVRSAGLKRVVYGVTGTQSHLLRGRAPLPNPLKIREIFQRLGATDIVVHGPLMEAEGLAIHTAALKAAAPATTAATK